METWQYNENQTALLIKKLPLLVLPYSVTLKIKSAQLKQYFLLTTWDIVKNQIIKPLRFSGSKYSDVFEVNKLK